MMEGPPKHGTPCKPELTPIPAFFSRITRKRGFVATPEVHGIPGFSDPVSSLTHLAGAGVFALLAIPLLRRGRGNRVRVACLGVYAFSSVLLLAISGVYHLLAPAGTGGRC